MTHPASWGTGRLEALAEAAERAGLATPSFVSEPEAAARYLADDRIGEGSFVAVYDLGGGTFDVAVLVRRHDGGFELAGPPGGRDGMGGEDFDDRLVSHVGGLLASRDSAGWQALASSEEPQYRHARRVLLAEVRSAKEHLSYNTMADLWVGQPLNCDVRLRRDEFEELIAADVEESITILERTISAAGLDMSQLVALYLTGG